MKNFWIRMYMRWSREELSGWGSFQKTVYLLWPLLIYFIVHDVTEILLWAAANVVFMGKESLAVFLQENVATFRGVINGLAILSGVAVIWKAVQGEITGAKKDGGAFDGALCGEANGMCGGASGKKPDNTAELVTQYFALTAIAFLTALGLNILMSLLGLTAISQSYEDTSRAQYSVNFVVGLFLYGVVSPFAEEAVFRGMIYNRMKRCFTYPVALCVSSLLFGCYHGNFVQAVYGTILGLLIAWCYENCGSFTVPVLVHAVANVSMYVMTYFGGLKGMSRPVSIGVMIVSLAGTGIIFRHFTRKE